MKRLGITDLEVGRSINGHRVNRRFLKKNVHRSHSPGKNLVSGFGVPLIGVTLSHVKKTKFPCWCQVIQNRPPSKSNDKSEKIGFFRLRPRHHRNHSGVTRSRQQPITFVRRSTYGSVRPFRLAAIMFPRWISEAEASCAKMQRLSASDASVWRHSAVSMTSHNMGQKGKATAWRCLDTRV